MRLALFLVISLAACEPDYSGTAFRCDDERACPDEQSCVHGRCRRGGAVGRVQCGGALCLETEQCCHSGALGARCIPAGDVCDGRSALCDSLDDCQAGDECCDGETAACNESCPENETRCTTDNDCPAGTEPFCCGSSGSPWKKCEDFAC
ncbi:MAG: hypothetical protein ACKV2T_16835 [Kofleriaceae bacterium]